MYADTHPELERVAFVNRYSFTMPKYARPKNTEAEAMADVARQEGLDEEKIVIGNETQSSLGGLAEAVRKRLIVPKIALLLVAHDNHIERIMEYAELALPGTPLKYLSTDNINRTTHNTTVTRNDKIAATIYGHALRGVQPGDINAIERADKRVQSYFAPFVAARGIIGARAARKLQRQVT
jgi:hypothetical protein